MKPRQIICMKWGTLYGPEYVNRLYGMISRNLDDPFRLVCLTDDRTGIREEVECYDCPEIAIKAPECRLGWRKITLWDTEVAGLEDGDALFIDLDVVITGDLTPLFSYLPEETFIVAPNWTQKDAQIGNTSLYRFKVGSHPYLLKTLLGQPDETLSKFPNSQTYISRTVKSMVFWPDNWCQSFKVHCVPKGIKRFFVEPQIPEGARVIAFPGEPNPDDAAAGRWPAPWYKKTYKFIRPTKWVDQRWVA